MYYGGQVKTCVNRMKENNNKLPLPIAMLLVMVLGGMGLFCVYVVKTVVESIPPDFTMPWYLNIIPTVMLIVSIVMLLLIKKYNQNPTIR